MFHKLFDCVLDKGLAPNSLSSSITVPIFFLRMIIHTLITTEELAWSVTFENFPQFQQKAHDPSRLYVYLRLYTVFFVKRIIFAYQQVHYGTGPL